MALDSNSESRLAATRLASEVLWTELIIHLLT